MVEDVWNISNQQIHKLITTSVRVMAIDEMLRQWLRIVLTS